MNYTPLVIIGAPRSGTNMLRDVLTSLPGFATWPCDEINYIWRHGNVSFPSDEIPPERASPAIRNYIQKQFDWVANRYSAEVVVEKTTANSLRVPFVDAVLPEAKYIFIRRDGMDALGSAMKRWTAPLDIPYLARKARFVPASDLPYYASRYLWNRVYRLFSREKRLAFWGPKMAEMDRILEQHPLDEVCALQWQHCVDQSAAAFSHISAERWLEIDYETVVTRPAETLARITGFLEIQVDPALIKAAVSGVRSDSVGKGRAKLAPDQLARLERLVGPTLARYGYLSAENIT